MDDDSTQPTTPTIPESNGVRKVRLLKATFGFSLNDIVSASGRSISKSALHRILNGQAPKAAEKRAISLALSSLLRERCDSAFLFREE